MSCSDKVNNGVTGFLQKWGIYQQSKGHTTLFIAYLEEAINVFTSLQV